MFPLFSEALNENVTFKDKIAYLDLINNSHILCLDEEDQRSCLKESITKLMSSSDTRYEGSLYLEALLKNDSKEYYHNWGPVIIASLKCPDKAMSKDLPLRILCDFVQNFAEDPAYSEPLNHFIPEIVEILLKADQGRPFFSHYCKALSVCMIYLPKILANSLIDLEAFIMKNLDCNSLETVQVLGECFAALPMCIAHFRKSKQQFAAVWVQTCDRALSTLQVLLNNILNVPGEDDLPMDVGDSPVFPIPPIPEEFTELSKALFYSRMVLSMCHCLAALLSEAKKTPIDVPVNDLLQSVVRILDVRDAIEAQGNFDIHRENRYQYFVLVFPHIQKGILTLLEAIIKNVSLHKHSKNFMRLLEMYIELPVIMGYSTGSQNQARTHVFKLIAIWLNEYGVSGVSAIAANHKLIGEMLSNIAIIDPHQLTMINGTKVSPLNSTFLKSVTTTTYEAMKTLKTLVFLGSSKIEKNLLTTITNTVIGCIQNIQRPIAPLFPFTSEECRKQLYSLLLSCTVLGNPNQVRILQHATRLFSVGYRDKSMLVKKVCNKAIKLCRLYLEPRKPPPDIVFQSLPTPEKKKEDVHDATQQMADNWNIKEYGNQHMPNQEDNYLYGAENRMNGGQQDHIFQDQSDSDEDSYHEEPSHAQLHAHIPNQEDPNLVELQPARMPSQQPSSSHQQQHHPEVHSLDDEEEEEDESMEAADEEGDEEEDEEVEEEEEGDEEEEEEQMPVPAENGMMQRRNEDAAEVYEEEEEEVYEEVEGPGQENELVTDSRKKNMGFYGLEEGGDEERPLKRQKLVSDEYGQEDSDHRDAAENEDSKVEEDDKEEEYVEEVLEEEEEEEKPEERKTVEKEEPAKMEVEPQEIEPENSKTAVPEIPPTNAETVEIPSLAETDEIPSLAEMKDAFVLDV